MLRQLALASVFVASTSFANECDVNMSGDMQLDSEGLHFDRNQQSVFIDTSHQLYINDQFIALDSAQQANVSEYYDSIHVFVPKVADIAVEAIDIAVLAVGTAFSELTGDEDMMYEVEDVMGDLKQEVRNSFYDANGNLRMSSKAIENGDFVSNDFEDELEERMEALVTNSMGSILISLGTEMLLSGGDMDAFEARMENFGHDIENRVEAQADQLEAKAELLCDDLYHISVLDAQLASSIPELGGKTLLDVEFNGGKYQRM